jgi:hypothetical protein
MELDWYCTGATGMKQKSCWGVLWFFKRPQVTLLEKQRNWQHDICCLITNTWVNRVAIVSSAITRYLTLANIGWSPFTLQYLFVFSASVFNRICCQFICCCLTVVFITLPVVFIHVHSLLFDCLHFASVCSTCFVWLFSVISVLILELYSKYFNPTYHQPSSKPINIIHQTAPSFVLVQEARACYNHRH